MDEVKPRTLSSIVVSCPCVKGMPDTVRAYDTMSRKRAVHRPLLGGDRAVPLRRIATAAPQRNGARMSEREHLQRWLTTGARRERLVRLLRALGTCTCIAAAIWLGWRALPLTGVPAAVLAALLPILLLGAGAACLIALAPAARRVGPLQAARLADIRAGLRDQLTSAQWFSAHRAIGNPLEDSGVALLLERTDRTLDRLQPAQAFPLRVPRRFALALVLAGTALSVPPMAATSRDEAIPVVDAAQSARTSAGRADARKPGMSPAEEILQPGAPAATQDRLAAQLESLAAALGGEADARSLRAALARGDRAAAVRQARALARKLAEEGNGGPAAPPDAKLNAEVAASILERLQEILREQSESPDEPAKAANAIASTARLSRQLRQEMQGAPEPEHAPIEHSAGEPELDRHIRAIARNNPDGRNVVPGEGEEEALGGNVRQSNGAMGRRVGQSRAGSGEGDQDANANPEGSREATNVLGQRTQRLQTQLQQVRVEREEAPAESDGKEDERFVLTQWESAQREYVGVEAVARRGSETRVGQAETPLAWRDAVRRYSLSQHEGDAAQRPPAGE